ncbi:hypothetical protein CEXT_385741 [Caerostris extrusa]|uniref:Uncharacterized protein n=1 Tax=Caerostris extrusa TaxID=172846 RepID=A0AAV4WBI9_CAEEX|nr:hypothetical protein CEXT_385741 [Caerostris extrusa]
MVRARGRLMDKIIQNDVPGVKKAHPPTPCKMLRSTIYSLEESTGLSDANNSLNHIESFSITTTTSLHFWLFFFFTRLSTTPSISTSSAAQPPHHTLELHPYQDILTKTEMSSTG